MILIGENIHIISKSVREALENRDESFVKELIRTQENMDYIDLNVGPAKGSMSGVLPWLTAQAEGLNISFDTTNTEEMRAGLEAYTNNAPAFINSTSKDEPRLEKMTDLAAEFDCNIIALTLSKDTGIPKTSDGRLEIAFEIYEKCMEKGIDSSKIYFDPLILPVSVEQSQAMEAVNTIQMIKESFDPPVKTVIGLSNISNGSPKELRPLINRVFAVLAFGAGLDAAIIDAKDLELVRILRMLENNKPESTTDELYINLSNMIKDFSDIENISYDKNNEEQSVIIKTVNILTGKKIYSHSFTQI
ncbi:MAG: dihydropteroate synthase [Brachyspira sp.]|nr:dihydropteroate synthase [Brachyspira sp.]